jgi:hypothetical protein
VARGVRTDAKGERLITLDVLPDSEARELLTRRIGTRRAKAEPAAVGELADTASRLRALQTGDPVTDVRTVSPGPASISAQSRPGCSGCWASGPGTTDSVRGGLTCSVAAMAAPERDHGFPPQAVVISKMLSLPARTSASWWLVICHQGYGAFAGLNW